MPKETQKFHSQVNLASTDVEADSWARPLLRPKLRELSGASTVSFCTRALLFTFLFQHLTLFLIFGCAGLHCWAQAFSACRERDFSHCGGLATERQPGTLGFSSRDTQT